jgi:uncharacterized integral membrane protein (TIGR00698 family)
MISLIDRMLRPLPGLLFALLVAGAAWLVSTLYGGPIMLYALLFGMAGHVLARGQRYEAGLQLSAKTLLRLGVALLGTRITLDQIATLGWETIAIVVAAVAVTMTLGQVIARAAGMDKSFSAVSATAVSICGVSAALTAASVVPRTPHLERGTVVACLTVTALSTIAMVAYPLISTTLGLDATTGGVFLGATIHDVAQVVGAGYMLSPQHGDAAVVTKLLRVGLLAPVVVALAILSANWTRSTATRRRDWRGWLRLMALPWFLTVFIVIVLLHSARLLPEPIFDAGRVASQSLLVLAIAALGLRTSLGSLLEVGWRPVAVMVVQTLLLAGFVLGALLLTGH